MDFVKGAVFHGKIGLTTVDAVVNTEFERTPAVMRITSAGIGKLFKCKPSHVKIPVKYMLNCVNIISFKLSLCLSL